MPPGTTDYEIAKQLAVARWGETGFRCDACGHTEAYHWRSYPRKFQCKRCRKQQSVTANTVMHGTKVPLAVWLERAAFHEANEIPGSRPFAREHGIAPSTAWHLNHRFMAAADAGPQEHMDHAGYVTVEIEWRRPKPTPPLPETAPEHLRETISTFRARSIRPPFKTEVILGFWGREVRLVDPCPTPERRHEVRGRGAWLAEIPNRGIQVWLRHLLEDRFDRVCLRWAGRYVRYALSLWNVGRDHLRRGVPPIRALLSWPKRTLRQLRDEATDFRLPVVAPPPPRAPPPAPSAQPAAA